MIFTLPSWNFRTYISPYQRMKSGSYCISGLFSRFNIKEGKVKRTTVVGFFLQFGHELMNFLSACLYFGARQLHRLFRILLSIQCTSAKVHPIPVSIVTNSAFWLTNRLRSFEFSKNSKNLVQIWQCITRKIYRCTKFLCSEQFLDCP